MTEGIEADLAFCDWMFMRVGDMWRQGGNKRWAWKRMPHRPESAIGINPAEEITTRLQDFIVMAASPCLRYESQSES